MAKKIALVTGSRRGIGLGIARKLGQMGYFVVVSATAGQDDEVIAALQAEGVDCAYIPCNIANADDRARIFDEIGARYGRLDVVVNNAGFGLFGPFAETDLTREIEMIQTNIVAVHILTKLFLRDFRRADRGYILNVASSAGFMAGPLMATYYATKNYVLRLTQAIREELRREGSAVRVAALCPGPVDTEFNDVANVRFSIRPLSAADAAAYGLRGLFAGRGILVPGCMMRLTLAARRFAPEELATRITYHIQHRKGSV